MYNMGFVSARFSGNDGVTLESAKWAEVLWDYGHHSFWFAGKLDRDPGVSMLVPKASFDDPDNVWINDQVWRQFSRSPEVTDRIHEAAKSIKADLYKYVKKFKLDFLILQNSLAMPMHIPLGVAITEFLAETAMLAISHNHDFYWERSRYLVNAVHDVLDMAFPPSFPCIQHVTINSAGRNELAWRKGLSSLLIPNVLDFEHPERYPTKPVAEVKAYMGFEPDDIIFLQPTRIVPRKGIEHAINIVAKLKNPKCKLMITHESGDEGDSYINALHELAADLSVDLRVISTKIRGSQHDATSHNNWKNGNNVKKNGKGTPEYSLWDVYPCADFVTYPSLYEGFGNALLEAVFFRKPVVINRYAIWIEDIEPKGFKAVSMDNYVTSEVVDHVRKILADKNMRDDMTNHNFDLAKRHYSYSVLRRSLRTLITNVTGLDTDSVPIPHGLLP